MDRETGTQTIPCGNCGTALATITLEDGAIGAVRCDKCWPTEKASAPVVAPREVGTDVEVDDD